MTDKFTLNITDDEFEAIQEFLFDYREKKQENEQRQKILKKFIKAYKEFKEKGGAIRADVDIYEHDFISFSQDVYFEVDGEKVGVSYYEV